MMSKESTSCGREYLSHTKDMTASCFLQLATGLIRRCLVSRSYGCSRLFWFVEFASKNTNISGNISTCGYGYMISKQAVRFLK